MATIQIKRGVISGLPSGSAGEPLFTTDEHRLYVGSAGGNRLMSVLRKNDASAAPTVNDDAGDGFSVGSVWTDTTNDKSYILTDSTVGAAVWQQFSGSDPHPQYDPPAGTGIVTVTGGAWGTPGPLTGDVTTPVLGGLVTTIANGAVGKVKLADGAVATVKIEDDAVTDAKLRHSAGLSVIGRSANSTGDPSDIVGATVGHALQVLAGPTVGFGYTELANGSDAGTNTTLSATSGTYTSITGWTFTAPTTGTYLVVASCLSVLQTTGAGPYIVVRSKLNGTATGDDFSAFYGSEANFLYQIPGTRSWVWALTAGDVVTFDAAITYTGTSTYREVNNPLLSYVRIA